MGAWRSTESSAKAADSAGTIWKERLTRSSAETWRQSAGTGEWFGTPEEGFDVGAVYLHE